MAEPNWEWFYNNFNTKLAPNEEAEFQQWLKAESKRRKRDLSKDLYTYDLRGAWKAGEAPDKAGHLTDRYKKPSHITFSDESMYHGGIWRGGSWGEKSFEPGPVNLQFYTPEQLQQHFQEQDPEFKLELKSNGSIFKQQPWPRPTAPYGRF